MKKTKNEKWTDEEKAILSNINAYNITKVLYDKDINTISLTPQERWDLYMENIDPSEIDGIEKYAIPYMLERRAVPKSSADLQNWILTKKKVKNEK